jgi:flagellar operon protein
MSINQGSRVNCFERPVNLIDISRPGNQVTSAQKPQQASFKEMFSQELASSRDVAFSRHAHERLFSRGITLSDESVNRIADAIDKAQSKGAKETLILGSESAFVVSVKNRTVITAFDRENLRQGVVTSIDSAVIL